MRLRTCSGCGGHFGTPASGRGLELGSQMVADCRIAHPGVNPGRSGDQSPNWVPFWGEIRAAVGEVGP